MTQVPASSHGGGTFNGGTITGALAVEPADGAGTPLIVEANDSFEIQEWQAADESAVADMDSTGTLSMSGALSVGSNALGDATRIVIVGAGQTLRDLLQAQAPGGRQGGISKDGALYTDLNTAPADATVLRSGRVLVWFDSTAGAPNLALKAKDSAGSVFTDIRPLRGGVTGALATTTFVSGTGKQIDTAADRELIVPVTYNPGAATIATCTVALSPDNVTYSTLGVETEPVGVAFDGSIHLLRLLIPAGWYIKLTVVNATIGTGTYY